MKKIKATEFDKIFDSNEKDILDYVDLKSARRVNLELKRVNVDFPSWMVQSIDKEAQYLGVTRQALIKMWIGDRLTGQTENTVNCLLYEKQGELNALFEAFSRQKKYRQRKGQRIPIGIYLKNKTTEQSLPKK